MRSNYRNVFQDEKNIRQFFNLGGLFKRDYWYRVEKELNKILGDKFRFKFREGFCIFLEEVLEIIGRNLR